VYLQSQRKRVNDLTRPSQAGFQQDAYDKEAQLLRMEENLLFDLVNYLQVPMSMIPAAGSTKIQPERRRFRWEPTGKTPFPAGNRRKTEAGIL